MQYNNINRKPKARRFIAKASFLGNGIAVPYLRVAPGTKIETVETYNANTP